LPEVGGPFLGTGEMIKTGPVGIPRLFASSKVSRGFLSPEELPCLIGFDASFGGLLEEVIADLYRFELRGERFVGRVSFPDAGSAVGVSAVLSVGLSAVSSGEGFFGGRNSRAQCGE
jgi:hypothetical protein